jgi:hypothetical protein
VGLNDVNGDRRKMMMMMSKYNTMDAGLKVEDRIDNT